MSKKAEKKANILISGDYGEGNIGDEIILSELVKLLSKAFPEVQLSVITKTGDKAAPWASRPCRRKTHSGFEPLWRRPMLW